MDSANKNVMKEAVLGCIIYSINRRVLINMFLFMIVLGAKDVNINL